MRVSIVAADDMYAEQRRVAVAVGRRRKPSVSSQGGLEGPFAMLLHVPGILDHMQFLGEYCRFDTGLPAKLRELAIIIAARHIAQPYEFRVHAMEAREFGLDESIIEDVAAERRPSKLAPDEAAVYDFCTELSAEGRVSDDVFTRTDAHFGKSGIIELIATCGYYSALGLVLNVTQWKPVIERVLPFTPPAD